MKEKVRYEVQLNEYIDYGDGETKNRVVNTYKTYARSSKEAIRNVEYRTGLNQYNCLEEMPGDGFKKLYFTAKQLTKEYEQEVIDNWKNDIFVKCPYCGYNNEKSRLQFYKACLNCHKPLNDKKYFEKKLKEKMGETD